VSFTSFLKLSHAAVDVSDVKTATVIHNFSRQSIHFMKDPDEINGGDGYVLWICSFYLAWMTKMFPF